MLDTCFYEYTGEDNLNLVTNEYLLKELLSIYKKVDDNKVEENNNIEQNINVVEDEIKNKEEEQVKIDENQNNFINETNNIQPNIKEEEKIINEPNVNDININNNIDIQQENEKAKRILNRTKKIDVTNTTTLRYLEQVSEQEENISARYSYNIFVSTSFEYIV